jgi:hypothetical protein
MPTLFFKIQKENKAEHIASIMNWPRKYGMARLLQVQAGQQVK